jgi:hypothetical protein
MAEIIFMIAPPTRIENREENFDWILKVLMAKST